MFDKKSYWENRKLGKRGQGDRPTLMEVISPKILGSNRRAYRRRVVDRTFTKSAAKHVVNDYGLQRESLYAPTETNHRRHFLRRVARNGL